MEMAGAGVLVDPLAECFILGVPVDQEVEGRLFSKAGVASRVPGAPGA